MEYCRRAPVLPRLVAYLDHAPPREAEVVLDCLMCLVAPAVPRTAAPEAGLAARLGKAGFDVLARAVAACTSGEPEERRHAEERRALLRRRFGSRLKGEAKEPDIPLPERHLAHVLWIEQQTFQDVDRLIEEAPLFAAHRLARVVPPDRPDIWERALAAHPYGDDSLLRAFCQWCAPAHRHLLVRHCDGTATLKRPGQVPEEVLRRQDLERASCAFHTYLALAPPEAVAHLARDQARPAWQIESLDRWIHAPRELRPPRPRCPNRIVFDLRESGPYDVCFAEPAGS